VHRSYLPEYRALKKRIKVKGLAHITGGGLLENIPRILPPGCSVEIDVDAWEPPPIFELLEKSGGVERTEMYRVFNMGVGMVLIADQGSRGEIARAKCRWEPFNIGSVVEGKAEVILET
jgi:phosphoribosylformylglycinamidine cyclo-ligase